MSKAKTKTIKLTMEEIEALHCASLEYERIWAKEKDPETKADIRTLKKIDKRFLKMLRGWLG